MVDVHERFIRSLEGSRKLDRELEALPSDEEIADRKRDHRGLTRPELATLLAYSKIDLYAELLDSGVPEDPYLSAELERYFPDPLPERFGDAMREHRLAREIVATQVVNNVLHGGGTTFVFRLHEETGAPASEIARGYAVAREIYGMRPQWAEIEALDNRVDSATQLSMLLEGRRLIERSTRWLLRHRSRPMDIASTVGQYRPARGDAVRGGAAAARPGGRRAATRARTSCAMPAFPSGSPSAWRRSPRCSPCSTWSRWRATRASTWRRWRPSTSRSATGSACTGCAIASSSCRATTTGGRGPARRCATTCTRSIATSRRRCSRAHGRPRTPARVEAWVEENPASERSCRRSPTSA